MLWWHNPALKAWPVALCSNGPLVHCHFVPAAREDPQSLSKTRKAKPQVMGGLMWEQWVLTCLLRALSGH